MDIYNLVEGTSVRFIDKFSVARKGTVLRNKTVKDRKTNKLKVFLTVQDEHQNVEVIQDQKKVTAIL